MPVELRFARPAPDTLEVRLAGRWRMTEELPSAEEVWQRVEDEPEISRLTFATGELDGWDSTLLTFLRQLEASEGRPPLAVDRAGLPAGVGRLLELASAVPESEEARRSDAGGGFFASVGVAALSWLRAVPAVLAFVGDGVLSLGRLATGRARFRRRDLFATLQQTGADALPIVSLLSFLMGLILAYVGAAQLRQFGAQIYVANLVGLAVVREMGALMTAIILAGRTGAAYAAQLGTMEANEEIDALRTLAIPPSDFLVLPRLVALVLMTPLLCLYANLLGIVGGAVIGVGSMGLGITQYYEQTRVAVGLGDLAAGLIKSAVFAVMIAGAGCYYGVRSGRSSAAVGEATTAAVVTGIVLIVVCDAILTVLYDIVGL